MIVEFFEFRYHQDEYDEYKKTKELTNSNEPFKGEFMSPISVDIIEIVDFAKNPIKYNGNLVEAVDLYGRNYSYFTIRVKYSEFKKLWESIHKKKVIKFSEAMKNITQ